MIKYSLTKSPDQWNMRSMCVTAMFFCFMHTIRSTAALTIDATTDETAAPITPSLGAPMWPYIRNQLSPVLVSMDAMDATSGSFTRSVELSTVERAVEKVWNRYATPSARR